MISYKEKIAEILAPHVDGLEKDEILDMLETPADSKMGDYAFPCFKLAKIFRKAPQMSAQTLAEAIGAESVFEKVENVNAYVNMFLSREEMAQEVVSEVIEKGDDYGRSNMGQGKKGDRGIFFSEHCETVPYGHIRSTVIGNSIYKIYDFLGYDTIRINHLGDYGTQFGKMICAYRRWGNKEDVVREPIKSLLSYYTKFHVEAEKDPALEDEARAIFAKLEKGEPEEVELWKWFREESLKEFKRVYDMLGIEFDSYNGESFYSDKMPRIVDELKEKGLLVEDNGAADRKAG